MHFKAEKKWKRIVEKKDTFNEDKIVSEELKREIELMEVDDNLKQQSRSKKQIKLNFWEKKKN